MDKTPLTLVHDKKKKRVWKFLIPIIIVLLIGIAVWFIITNWSIEAIEIDGTSTYTDEEVIHAMQESDYVPNTLVMILENRIFNLTYLPFIEKVTMSWEEPHVLKVHIKEGLRAGVFEYMGKYVYFNEDGMAMESRNRLFDEVPVITGLDYDKLVLGEKIPVKDDYFPTIVMITKKIASYKLNVSEIHFDDKDQITLTAGDFQIFLGIGTNIEDKMSKIPSVLEAVSKKHKKGTIDLSLCDGEKEIITFSE